MTMPQPFKTSRYFFFDHQGHMTDAIEFEDITHKQALGMIMLCKRNSARVETEKDFPVFVCQQHPDIFKYLDKEQIQQL